MSARVPVSPFRPLLSRERNRAFILIASITSATCAVIARTVPEYKLHPFQLSASDRDIRLTDQMSSLRGMKTDDRLAGAIARFTQREREREGWTTIVLPALVCSPNNSSRRFTRLDGARNKWLAACFGNRRWLLLLLSPAYVSRISIARLQLSIANRDRDFIDAAPSEIHRDDSSLDSLLDRERTAELFFSFLGHLVVRLFK